MLFKNLALGTVLTAPSPATSGTSVVLNSGQGAYFPQPSSDGAFFATAFPAGTNPSIANAEIVKVTARSTDTFTIVRAQRGTTAKSIAVGWVVVQGIYAEEILALYAQPSGTMINGKIVTSVSSNNLTVAIKQMDGNDATPESPISIRIGNTVRQITAALSVTKNAGTNWFSSGVVGLATKEIDYFVYIGYNATDGVVVGFARFPGATTYGEFSATSTAETYCAISTISNASSSDVYETVGRFNATLSGTSAFNWSIPGTSIIVNRPIFESRTLSAAFVPTAEVGTITTATSAADYKVRGRSVTWDCTATVTTNGTGANALQIGTPFTISNDLRSVAVAVNTSVGLIYYCYFRNTGIGTTIKRYDNTYNISSGHVITASGTFNF